MPTLTEQEIKDYKLNESELKMLEGFKIAMAGEEAPAGTLAMKEFLASPSASVLIPKVIIGAMREAAEPLYIASKMLKKVRLQTGQSMVFPSIGIMRAYDVGEGQEIPEDTIDWQTHEVPEIRVGKSGVRVRVSSEMVADSQWDIVSMLIEQAGRAMARHKEQKCFNAFSKHGHTVFDNADPRAAAKTTGLDYNGVANGTMSAEDFLDMAIIIMNNEFTPGDILMHPLSWSAFAKTELANMVAANPYTTFPAKGAPASMAMGPSSIQGRLPFSFNVQLSPFIPVDKKNKTYDMYFVDKNNIGVLLVRDELKTEQFDEPARDIHNVKCVERYGVGVLYQGRAVAVAKNISMNKAFNIPIRVKNI